MRQSNPNAISSSSQSSIQLNTSITLRQPDEMKVEPSFIAVPSYGTPPISEWGLNTEIETAANDIDAVSRTHIYIYQSSHNIDDFSWQKFLTKADKLAEDVADLADKFPRRPIIFIAHSLGGILLKRALLLAKKNTHDSRFRLVLDCLSGILFLGTPHGGVNDDDTLLHYNQILYSCTKQAMRKQSSTKLIHQERAQLAGLAERFEQIASVPLLSVFQQVGPRSPVREFLSRKTKAFVDEQLATISTDAERTLGVHLEHKELCKIPLLKDETFSARDFLRSVLEDIASQPRWTTEYDRSIPKSPRIDQLNPLNLADLTASLPLSGELTSVKRPHSIHVAGYSTQVAQRNSERLLGSKEVSLPCFALGQTRNQHFLGRESIMDLIDEHLLPITPSNDAGIYQTRHFCICGMGGMGKTDIAIEYAYTRKSKFDAIIWLQAAGLSQLATDFARITRHLGLETAQQAKDLDSSTEIAKAWLTSTEAIHDDYDPNFLLIFDNADDLDVLQNYVPYRGNGAVLITSRDPTAREYTFSKGINLDPLSSSESAMLFRVLTNNNFETLSRDEKMASQDLADKMDGLPLAITQISGFIHRRQLSMREFVSSYVDERYAEVHKTGTRIQDIRYGQTLATTWNFQGLSDGAWRLLQLISFLSPDRISERILISDRTITTRGPGFWSRSVYEDARTELLTSSIIKRNVARQELWIHRIIQQEVRTRMGDHDRYDKFVEDVRLLNMSWPPGDLMLQNSERWAICEELLPHVEQCYQLYIEYAEPWRNYVVDISFPNLLNEAGGFLHEQGLSGQGKPYLQLALELLHRANITEEPLASEAHLTMGALCNVTKDKQNSLEHDILCLNLRKDDAARRGQPNIRLAFAYSQMGIGYMGVKRYAKGLEYFKQSVELFKLLAIEGDPAAFPICNLGLGFWIQDMLDDANVTLTELLEDRERRHGKLDTVSYATGRVLHALGNVRSSLAKRAELDGKQQLADEFWAQSFQLHKDTLQQYESTLGKSNYHVADACHKVAEHYIRLRETELVKENLDRAISTYGEREWFRGESARSSFLLGTYLVSLDDEESRKTGEGWIERAKALRRELLPSEKPKELHPGDFDELALFWSI